jgi:hypothetical protein
MIGALLVVTFGGGMAFQNYRTGDLIIARGAGGACVAYDPDTRESHTFGLPDDNGRCHLWRYRLFG